MTDSPIRILIIDDDEDDYFITSDYIRNISDGRYITDWCYRYQDALEIIKQRKYDLYFVDYYLGAKTGLNLIKEALQNDFDEPMVLLTGKGNQAIDREAMQAGAMDYLIKSELNEEKLERCIRYAIERTNSIKALRANERKYRSIFERSKDSVFLAGPDLYFKDVNDATCITLRYNREELLGMSLYEFMDSNEAQAVKNQLQETGVVHDRELELITREGETKTCILSLSSEQEISGERYIHGLLHDITHLKKAEKATLQAEKLAATGRLVQTLAHEVRNPLNNINLSIEQISHELREVDDNNIYLDIVERNSKRIGDIITELLNSSRPAEMVMTRTPLQVIADDTIQSALDRITLKKVKLQINYASEPAFIQADTQKLKIALLNIIINAVEAMEEGSGLLEISISSEAALHTIKITDNGSGISSENLSRLFEPYFTSKRNGLGLGLASSLNILQSHKAQIDVNSELNKGTSFIISFPAA